MAPAQKLNEYCSVNTVCAAERLGWLLPSVHSPSCCVIVQVLAGTVKAAQESKSDVVLCDTSGRLHTNWRLMDELQLVVQDIDGVQKGAPHETLLVLDGSTGLNMMNQVLLHVRNQVLMLTSPHSTLYESLQALTELLNAYVNGSQQPLFSTNVVSW